MHTNKELSTYLFVAIRRRISTEKGTSLAHNRAHRSARIQTSALGLLGLVQGEHCQPGLTYASVYSSREYFYCHYIINYL